MKILILEAYFGGSHKHWIQGLVDYSHHDFKVISLPASYWKWRMHGGAISLAEEVGKLEWEPELIITTSMTDVSILKSLLPTSLKSIPIHLYIHENQFAYQWSSQDRDHKTERKDHYYFIQYVSALASDKVFFNSSFNRSTFIDGCTRLLKSMPDLKNLNTIQKIESKSSVLALGLPWDKFDGVQVQKKNEIPLIVWNHRWEEDKNPVEFFKILRMLKERGFLFELCLLGDKSGYDDTFINKMKDEFQNEIIHLGMVPSYKEYISWLKKSDISIVTSNQDFFGISILETVYCEVATFLPKRLAYPEHFEAEGLKWLFYDDHNDLLDKIIHWKEIPVGKYKIRNKKIQLERTD